MKKLNKTFIMNFSFKSYLKHFLAVIVFSIISVAYFNPILSGKAIFQNDIKQYIGMSKQQQDFSLANGEETYWTNSAFGGMPTYQLGAKYANNYIKKIDSFIRFLPRPADYLFIYLVSFYILLLALKIDFDLAFLGALAFGFSTYLIIILGVGHNAKAHAIAYMPLVLSGIFMVFNKNYISGILLTALASGLELVANHYQMTYYLFILILVLLSFFIYQNIQKKAFTHILKSFVLLFIAALLAIGMNASSILSTKEYSNESTRGTLHLTINPDGTDKIISSGLDYSYITEYSYGLIETLNLFIPRFLGGGSYEDVGRDSSSYEFFIKNGLSPIEALNQSKQIPTYWGEQPIVEAPAYIGAVILFCFVLALFTYQGKHRKWIISVIILSLLLSFGKNFAILTDFFIAYFPLYNKFRAVSSIQVLLELCIPLLAIIGLTNFYNQSKINKLYFKKRLLYSLAITGGLCLSFLLFRSVLFDFVGNSDGYFLQNYGQEFVDAIRNDRISFFMNDTLRTLCLVLITFLVLYAYHINKINRSKSIITLVLLVLFDLIGVDRRYVNNENFTFKRQVETPFVSNKADKEILNDTTYFRVHDLTSSGAKASYFHNSIGGYHAAKLSRFNDIIDFYINRNNLNVLNMLNVKYIILNNEAGVVQTFINDDANGNAWFVSSIDKLNSPNEEILSLKELENKNKALTTDKTILESTSYDLDSLAYVKLVKHQPNEMRYKSSNSNDGFIVFSEIFYPYGWEAYIDGELTDIHRVNYLLRGVNVPKGKHVIELKFNPKVVYRGQIISLWAFISFLLLIAGVLVLKLKKVRKSE